MAGDQYLPVIDYFVHRICTADWQILHQQINFQDLTYVVAGKGYFLVDDVRYDVSPGSLISIPAGCWREAHTDTKDPLRLYAFNYHTYDATLQQVPVDLPIHHMVGLSKELLYNLVNMERIWALKEPNYQLMASSVFLAILHHMLLRVKGDKSSYADERVQQVVDYVLANLQRCIPTQELVDLIALHPVYLNSLVQKHTGYSLRNFINRIKVNMAEDAIKYDHLPLQEAATRFGFTDIYYFSRVFKKLKGYPPSYIKKLRG